MSGKLALLFARVIKGAAGVCVRGILPCTPAGISARRETVKILAQSPLDPWPYHSLAFWECPGIRQERYTPQAGGQGWEEAGHVTAKLNVNFGR